MSHDDPETVWVILDELGAAIEGERYETKQEALVGRARFNPNRLLDIEEREVAHDE